jgi:hypothetical protein
MVAVKPSGSNRLGAVVPIVAGEVTADLCAVFFENLENGMGKGSHSENQNAGGRLGHDAGPSVASCATQPRSEVVSEGPS